MPAPRSRFDANYYKTFYEDPRTRSVGVDEVRRQVAFVAAYLSHLEIPVRSVLDVGCGLGLMRDALARSMPGASYRGVDISPFVCERMGFEPGSVVDYSPGRKFDLVICHDVIQYLDHRDAARAIANLSTLTRHAALLAVLTREDVVNESIDPERTDDAVVLRSTRWYRSRLRGDFVNVGGGLFLKRDRAPVLWTLEHLD